MRNSSINNIAILGAGAGGCACAVDLNQRGYKVFLHARRESRIDPILEKGGIDVTGGIHEGFVELNNLTTNLEEAITNADLIIIAVPAPGLSYYAKALSSILNPAQIVFLNPGQTGGGLHFTLRNSQSGI